MSEMLNISAADFEALMSDLQRVADGAYAERLNAPVEGEVALQLQSVFNAAIQSIDNHLGEDRDATMSLALGMADCFTVLDRVRAGDLSARVGEDTLGSDVEMLSSLGRTLNETIADIDRQIDTIRHQQETQAAMEHLVRQLQTPILELWDDVLALPVIGMVDSRRSADMMETLLQQIVAHRSKYVILDVTGVEIVDTRTADHFVKVMKSAELLGTRCVMTGIRPAVAQTLVELGVDLSSIRTLRNLQEGLRYCLRESQRAKAATLSGDES
jgi:anti-anti-sigma regulatory factor